LDARSTKSHLVYINRKNLKDKLNKMLCKITHNNDVNTPIDHTSDAIVILSLFNISGA
jgi:hypothetical protein